MSMDKEKTLQDLEKENRLLKAIIEAVSDGVYAVDKDGTILVYNSALEKMEGINKGDALGKKDYDVYPWPVEKYQRMAVLKNKKPLLEQYMAYNSAKGKKVDIVYNSFPFYDNGELAAVYSVGRDLPSINDLMTRLVNLFNNRISKNRKNGTTFTLENIVGFSPSITLAIEKARKVASVKSTVTLIGETGSGKELFAQGIHNASSSASQPFIAVNCAAIPETLMESLMMGTVKGAFSGALDVPGFFEQAENGTLFLDEINSLSLQLQPKLLRLLQDKTVRRIGGNLERKINCRIICATNENLFELAEKGQFREDLLYRLTAVVLDIPPLRERSEDIPLLAQKFIDDFNKDFNLNIREITPELMEFFIQYDWPGNVRELEHIIESAMSLSNENDTLLTLEHLPALIKRRMEKKPPINKQHLNTQQMEGINLNTFLRQCEKEFIESTLAKQNGNVAAAAKQLGIARQNLHYRLRKLSIESDMYRNY